MSINNINRGLTSDGNYLVQFEFASKEELPPALFSENRVAEVFFHQLHIYSKDEHGEPFRYYEEFELKSAHFEIENKIFHAEGIPLLATSDYTKIYPLTPSTTLELINWLSKSKNWLFMSGPSDVVEKFEQCIPLTLEDLITCCTPVRK